MKTIEIAYIFPFTLMIIVTLILLSFSLHDMILYKAASYKYLTCNGPNSADLSVDSSQYVSPLTLYINKYSLTNNYVDLEKNLQEINIKTKEYDSTVICAHYNKCDILRKCSAAAELINTITDE